MLSDQTIRGVIDHVGVVGIIPANWARDSAWKRPKTKSDISVDAVVYQLAGDARPGARGHPIASVR